MYLFFSLSLFPSLPSTSSLRRLSLFFSHHRLRLRPWEMQSVHTQKKGNVQSPSRTARGRGDEGSGVVHPPGDFSLI